MEGAAPQPLHIVQIGSDDTVFQADAPSDTLRRQIDYARELARRRPGSCMTVIMLTYMRSARTIEQEGLRIVPVVGSRLSRWPKLYGLLQRLHAARPIDVITTQTVHTDAWVALWFGARHTTPVVGQIHYDLFAPSAQHERLGRGMLGGLRQAISVRLLRRMAAVRVDGGEIAPRLRAAHVQNVAVIPIPVTMALDPMTKRRSPEPLVLFVGRLAPQKNLGLWLRVAQRVAERVPQAQFELVGDGPLLEELRAETLRLHLEERVKFSGHIAYSKLDQVYNRAGVFLLTSNYEGLVRVVIEASLHGVPVVATAISGVRDIISHGETGFLHAQEDVEGLAASVIRLLEDPAFASQIGRRGEQSVREHYDPERLTREWVTLLINSARRSPMDVNHRSLS